MGGSLGITLITPDGQMYKMKRWTNSLPDFVKNVRFFNKDQEHINEYLKSWLEMKEDWEKNGPNGPFELEMTDAYFPHDTLSPAGYGMVLIDMQSNRIYSSQGYTRLSSLQFIPQPDDDDFVDEEREEEKRIWNELSESGRFANVTSVRDGAVFRAQLNVSPFLLKEYGTSSSELLDMFEDISQKYTLSEEEISLWKKFMDELRECELEDEED